MRSLFTRSAALTVTAVTALAMTGSPASAIVGGRDATQQYPGVTSLNVAMDDGRTVWCGAALIHPRFLLTAAHCVSVDAVAPTPEPVAATTVTARIGSADRTTGVPVQGRTVYLHPDWMWGVDTGRPVSDLALVELTTPVHQPVTPISPAQARIGGAVRLVGWGLTTFPPPAPMVIPTILQERDTTRLPATACASGFIGRGEMCTDGGACYGDSGSPALRPVPTGPHSSHRLWAAIGIASRETTSEPSCGAPTVWTDPTYPAFYRWIITKILTSNPQVDPCTCPPRPNSTNSTDPNRIDQTRIDQIRIDRFQPAFTS